MTHGLTSFWLNQCNESGKAYKLLESYQYHHKWTKYGDLGGIHARISGKYFEHDENGVFYIAQAVWYDTPCMLNYVESPCLQDIIAWHPDNPSKWYFYRGETGLILGEKAYFESGVFHTPLPIKATPFSWLKSGCQGITLLDHHGLNKLYGLKEVVCEDMAHGLRLEKGLNIYFRRSIPSISIPKHNGGAQ